MVDRIGAIIDKYPRTAQTPEQHQKDLEDMMAELSGKLPGAMKTFGAGQTPPRRQTQYLNQYQAGQVGIPLPKDWQLKLLPVDDLNGMPHYSYVMPDGWEATDYGTFVDPTGKRYTAEQYNALEPWNVPYQREKLVARLSFSDEMPVTERMRVETEQTMFLETVSTYERTSELEDLLKELFNIDDAQVDQLFVKDPLRVDPSAQWPGGYEQKQYYDYIEQTEALTNEPSLSKAITNPSRLPPEEYSLMGFDPGSVWDVTKNIGSVLGAMFEGLFSNVTVGPQYSDTQGPGSEEFTSLPRWISPLGLNIRKSFATYFTGSIGDLARDIAFHAEVKGYDGIASGLRGMVKGFDFQSPPDPGIEERGWELYANPRYYQTQFAQPLAFSMALMPFTLLGPGVALGVGAGTVGTLIITTLFTIAGANVIESSTEAGGAARQAQAMGMSRAEQERVADEVFKGNMIALGASNPGQILFGLATKLPFIGNNPFLRLGFKVAGEAIWEAGEEATQDVLTRTALGQKVEFDYQMQENLIAGGMMGGGTGVIFDALGRLQSRAINNLPEAQFKTFQNLVEQFKKEGWTESTAILKALDDIAKTPEGATAVRAAVIETQMDEARRQLDMMGSDDFVVPSSKSIIDSEFAQSWYKRMERKIAKAPFMKKTIETLFGTRELTELESQVTKDIVGRSAILYHMIQKMGKELATAEAHILHGRFIDSAKAFGFNKVGFSQQMQDSLADVYSEHKDIAGTVEHVFTHKEMYHLSEAQSEYIDKVLHIFHRLLAQAKREGTAPKNLVVGEYIHRVVTGKIVDGELVPIRGAEGRGGKALGAKDKSRVYKTMAEGIADNTAYSPNIEDSIRTAIQNDYKKIADKRLADALSEYGDTPLALLMEKYPELEKRYQETKGERDRANKLKAAVNIAAHGGVFQASQLRALRRQFPYITERLMDLTRQRQDNAELLNSEVKRLTKAVERLRDYNARVVEGKERSIKKLNNELIGLIEKQKITEASMKEAFNLLDFKSRGTMSDVLLSQIQSLETQRENLKSELAEANVEDSKLINSSIKKIDVLIKQAQKYSEWLSEEMWSSTKQYYDSVEHHQDIQDIKEEVAPADVAKPTVPELPTQIEGTPEAGLQKDIFGFWTEVRPKGKGKITQISMDEYNLLMKQWKENGHEGTPPNIGYAPDMTGEKSTEYFINEDMSDFDLQSPQKTEKEIKTELNLLQKEVENLKNKKKIDYEKARIKRKERLDRIKQGGMKLVTLPDGIEGNKGYIMQPMFGGKLYNQDFIDSINQFFGHEKGSSSLQFFADAAGILRLTKAAFDNSAPLIQGFPAHGFAFSKMITDPKTGYHLMGQWFKSIAISTGSFLDMGFAGRYVEANESVILEMVKNGSSLQAVDYFQTLGEQKGLGGLANKFLSALPLAPFQRAETAFFIAAQVSRTETYKAMHDKAKKNGQLRELARFVDRMTGIIDTSAMSVPQKMRQFEQAFMWFAPRYTRATASVVADVFRGGMTGSMARESLGGMISALALYTTAFTCFQGFLGNEDEDDINRRIMQNFGIDKDSITGETVWDPSAKLMSFKIGNRYFGVGGAYYSLVRLFGNIMECINEVGDREIIDLARIIKYGSLNRDNPFISWWYSRSSPLIGFFRDALYPLAKSVVKGELQTGSTYFGTPIETPAEYGYYIASKFMPIWIEQGIMPFAGNYLEKWLPNMSQEFEKPTGLAAVLTPFAEFFGFRGFVEGEWTIFYDEAQLIINDLPKEWLSLYYTEEELVLVLQAQERGELSFKQLPKQAQQDLLNDNDDLKLLREYATEASAIQRSEEWRNYFAEREEEMDYRNTGIYNAGERLRKGEINDFEYREILEIVFAVYNKGIEELETNPNYSNVRDFWERLDERESKYDWSLDRALNEYEAIIYDESLNDPVTGDYNYEELDRRKGLWIEKWGMVKYENILTYIGNNKAAQDYPEMFLTRRKDLEILGREYWDLPTKPLYEMTEDDLIEGKVPHEHELLVRILLTKTEEDAYESFIKGHPELTKDYKAEYRAEHPEEDAMLKLWGYGGDLQTMEAYDITMKRAKELEFTEERLLVMKLTPRVYAETDFGYKDVTREFTGNSAEAKLYRIDHSAWANNWANEAYNWKELDVNENVLRIDVNFREQDNEYAALLNSEDEQAYLDTNEEYWTARLVRDAYKNDVEVKYHEKYIKYKKMPVKGKAQERFLRDNPDYYKDVWLNEDVLGNQPVTFDNIPSIEYDKLYAENEDKFDEYFALTDRGDREDYLYNDHDFAIIKYKADAYEKMVPENYVSTYADYMVIPPKAKDEWFINNQKYYNYVSYYEEEWYMIEHPEYHDEIYVKLQGNQPMKLDTVPTREVFKLYQGYLTEDAGSDRLDYRALYPDLDKWMLLTKKVTKLVGDRGIPQYSDNPVKRAGEIIDEYF